MHMHIHFSLVLDAPTNCYRKQLGHHKPIATFVSPFCWPQVPVISFQLKTEQSRCNSEHLTCKQAICLKAHSETFTCGINLHSAFELSKKTNSEAALRGKY